MVLEWMRRSNEDFAEQIDDYLYRDGDIVTPSD
jgi:hypothetical protein